jgi:hypothetical protein
VSPLFRVLVAEVDVRVPGARLLPWPLSAGFPGFAPP